jgi:C4-dicarboxylate-specific signal transduction histidine kinase
MSVAINSQPNPVSESHFVHFYRDERFLSGALVEFIKVGLEKGEGIVVIATEEHIAEICKSLTLKMISQIRFVDARWALKNIFPQGRLNRNLFTEQIQFFLSEMKSHYKKIRIFGEMVNLLCEENRTDAAIELEEYWNKLLENDPEMVVMCGYNLKNLNRESYKEVLASHSFSSGNEDENYSIDSLCRKVSALEIRNMESRILNLRDKNSDLQKRVLHSNKLSGLGEITAGLAHEIMNPITIISSYSDTINMAIKEESFETKEFVTKQLSGIHSTVGRMSSMMRNILKYAHDGEEKEEEFCVNSIIQDAVEMQRAILKSHNITIKFERSEEDITMCGDSTHLMQILFNLFSNAKDAFGEFKGLKKGIVSVRVMLEDSTFKIIVEDNGSGIESHVLENMWKPFYTTKSAGKGTGLGLSIIQRIVHDYGGSINCSSVRGEGTRFTIVLPCV